MDRTWLAVQTMLVGVIVASEPYDAEGAFRLIHAVGAGLSEQDGRASHAASRRHLVAILDPSERHVAAARASMVRMAAALERLRATA